jgi:hypothetical protein
MELIEGSETSTNYNRTPGKYPKEYIQDSKHGESLKSRRLPGSVPKMEETVGPVSTFGRELLRG